MRELLVGTRKGLFVLRGERAGCRSAVAARAFDGRRRRVRDARPANRSLLRERHVGLLRTPADVDRRSSPASGSTRRGPRFPEGHRGDARPDLGRRAGEATGPAVGRRRSGRTVRVARRRRDLGASTSALWKQRIAGDWQPGVGGLCLHSICPWPGEPETSGARRLRGRRVADRRRRRDVDHRLHGLDPRYLPEEVARRPTPLCVHNMHRAPTAPERLFMQFHGGVYRSDDAGDTWNDDRRRACRATSGSRSAIDPADPDSAFVIPMHGRR